MLDDINILIAPPDCEFLSLSDDDEGLTFEKEHAYVGDFQKGDFKFGLTEDTLRSMADETNRYITNGNLCPLPVEHNTDPEKVRGMNTEWSVKKDSKGRMGLFSKVKFTDADAAKLARTSQTSIFSPPTHTDGHGVKYTRPIRHAALTVTPVLTGLDDFTPIAASFVDGITKETSMPLLELAASIGLELSEGDDAEKAITEAFAAKDAIALEFSEYKKLNPPKSDPVQVSNAQVNMLREMRELKLSNLVEKGNILSCVAKKLEEIFCSDSTLTLSLSEDVDDNFDKVFTALKDNDSIKLSEVSGPQSDQIGALALSEEKNPVIANALKRANAAN